MERDPTACTDLGSVGTGAVKRENTFVDQFKTEYITWIMSFLIARMVSEPDYDKERRWRRVDEDGKV